MKSCQLNGYCEYRRLGHIGFHCSYMAYCDYQAPKDSRVDTDKYSNNDSIESMRFITMCKTSKLPVTASPTYGDKSSCEG